MPTLQWCDSAGVERTHVLGGDVVSFGRSPDCNVVIDARGVSRQHGRFLQDVQGRWCVEDLGSKNGVLVAGRYVTHHVLGDGDRITVGDVTFTFRADAGTGPTTSRTSVTISDTALSANSTTERRAGALTSMDARRLTAIYEISKRLMDQRDVPGLIDVASSSLIGELDAEIVIFGLTRDPERETDRLVVRPASAASGGITLSRSVLRRTLDAQRAVVVTDTHSDDALVYAQSIVAGGIRSALCVPMMRQQDVTGFIYVDSRQGGRRYDDRDLEFACAVGAMVGTAIENARLHEADLVKQRMEAELARARRVQQGILPSRWPVLEGWDVYGQHATCREVGGDYYDAIVTEGGRLWMLIADVVGKGAPAALLASSVQAAVHAMIDQCSSPAHLLTRLNELMLRRELEASFVTCLAVLVELRSGDVLLASAGHPYPVYVPPADAPYPVIVETDFMLGIRRDANFVDTCWSFPDGAGTLLAYTDGVSEAFDPQGEAFGEERLIRVLSQCAAASARDVVGNIQNAVEAFRGPREQSDDLTLLACRRCSGAGSPPG